jgi:high affinity Mn2+ porin
LDLPMRMRPPEDTVAAALRGLPLGALQATADYQFVVNPAYNRDRGPVSALSMRLHAQFWRIDFLQQIRRIG